MPSSFTMDIKKYIVIAAMALIQLQTISTSSNCDTIDPFRVFSPEMFDYVENDFQLNHRLLVGNEINPPFVTEGDTIYFLCDYVPQNETIREETVFYFILIDCRAILQADYRPFFELMNVSMSHDENSYACEARGPLGILYSVPISLKVRPNSTSNDEITAYEDEYRKLIRDPIMMFIMNMYESINNSNSTKLLKYYPDSRSTRFIEMYLYLTDNQTTTEDIKVGNDVFFYCAIKSPDPVDEKSIKYYFNGTILPQDENKGIFYNGHNLILRGINKTAAGNYSCSVDDSQGTLISDFYELKVHKLKSNATTVKRCKKAGPLNVTLKMDDSFKPNFTFQFSNVLFTCEANSSTRNILSLQWYRNNIKVKLNTTIGVHIIDTTLKINRIRKSYEGTYICRIQTADGFSCSNPVRLDVLGVLFDDAIYKKFDKRYRKNLVKMNAKLNKIAPESPSLQIHVKNRLEANHVNEFLDVYLICNVKPKNVNIRKYAWFHNGTRIYTNLDLGIISDGSHLTIRSIRTKHVGKFICQGQTDNDIVYSKAFLLRVREAFGFHECFNQSVIPVAELYTANYSYAITVQQWSNVSLHCQIYPNTTEIYAYSWFLDGLEFIPDNDTIKMINSTLHFSSIEKYDSGRFVCRAKTDFGNVYSNSVKVLVQEKAYNATNEKYEVRITLKLGEILDPENIRESDDIYFVCTMNPKILNLIRVNWFHENNTLSPNDYPSYKFSNSTLVMKNIKKGASGRYRCKVKTDKGYLFSEPVEITVKDKLNETTAEFTKTPDNVTMEITFADGTDERYIREYDDVHLTCTILPDTVSLNRTIVWVYNIGTQLHMIENNRITIIDRGTRSTLIIQRVDLSYIGGYSCGAMAMDNYVLSSRKTQQLDVGYASPYAPPTIQAKLNNEKTSGNVKESEIAYLTCNIRPHEKNVHNVTWFHNDTKINNNEKTQILLHTSTLILNPVRRHLAGKYHCQVKTDRGHYVSSNPVMLTVIRRYSSQVAYSQEILVIAEPGYRPQWIREGDKMVFRCYVFPTHQMYYYGKENADWYFNRIYYINENARNERDVLNIYGIAKKDIGNYSCAITTSDTLKYTKGIPVYLAHVNDKASPITMLNSDRIEVIAEMQEDPEKIYINDTVYFYCEIKSARKITLLEWFHNDRKVESGNGYYIDSNYNRTLKVYVDNSTAAGNYSCKIHTFIGIFESMPTLIEINNGTDNDDNWNKGDVKVFNQLEGSAISKQYFDKNDVSFTCNVEPDSTVIISVNWYKDGHEICPNSVNFFEDRTLILHDVRKEDNGNYSCEAITKKGNYSSNPVPLKVADIVRIVAELQDCGYRHYENMSAYFYCKVEPANVEIRNLTWYRNGKKIDENYTDISFELDQKFRVLRVLLLRKEYEGKFQCEVTTAAGTYRSHLTPLEIIDDEAKNLTDPWSTNQPFLLPLSMNDFMVRRYREHKYIAHEYDTFPLYCHIKPKETHIFQVFWYHNNTRLVPNLTGERIRYGIKHQEINLNSVSFNSSGKYHCVAETKKGLASSLYTLDIKILRRMGRIQ